MLSGSFSAAHSEQVCLAASCTLCLAPGTIPGCSSAVGFGELLGVQQLAHAGTQRPVWVPFNKQKLG